MESKIRIKKQNEGIEYNPVLDRYKDVVMFPDKVAQAKKNLSGRNLLKESDEADKKKITKPYRCFDDNFKRHHVQNQNFQVNNKQLRDYMKNFRTFFLLTLLFLLGNSVIGQSNKNDKLKNKIEKINSEVTKALIDKKIQSIMSYYDDDAISMPEYQASLIKKEEIENYYSLFTKRFNIKSYNKEITEIIDFEKRVIEIGNFEASYYLIEKDTTLNLNGSYLNIWERTKNGGLKVLTESWNYRHDVKNRELFTFSELGKSSWNDSYLKIDTTSTAFELAGLNELMTKTVSSHNPQLWVQFFTTDAKYIYSHTPVQEGINDINQHLIDHCKYLPKFDKLLIGNNRIEILNGYIIEYASHYVDWSFGETKGISTGKDIRIWKRMPDCSLKIYRQIAMYDN